MVPQPPVERNETFFHLAKKPCTEYCAWIFYSADVVSILLIARIVY